jgi:hypothetical protein
MNRKLPFIIYHNEWGYDQNEVVHLKDLSPTKWTYVWKKERNRSPAWSHIYFIWTNVYFVHFKVRYNKKLSYIKDMEGMKDSGKIYMYEGDSSFVILDGGAED